MKHPEKITMDYVLNLVKERDEMHKNAVPTSDSLKELNLTEDEYYKEIQKLIDKPLELKVDNILFDIAHERITSKNNYDTYELQQYEYPDNLETEFYNLQEEIGYDEYFEKR